jgi:hypothetical protein
MLWCSSDAAFQGFLVAGQQGAIPDLRRLEENVAVRRHRDLILLGRHPRGPVIQGRHTEELVRECVHRVDRAAMVIAFQVDAVVFRIGIDAM